MLLPLLRLQGRWLTPNVYTVPLGRGNVDWHVDRGIVTLACVGRDMIKVWPLPVERFPIGDDMKRAPSHRWPREARGRGPR